MKNYSKVSLELSESDLITLRRFFNRGVNCAEMNHDNFTHKIGTYDCGAIAEKLKIASKEMKLLKAKALINVNTIKEQ